MVEVLESNLVPDHDAQMFAHGMNFDDRQRSYDEQL